MRNFAVLALNPMAVGPEFQTKLLGFTGKESVKQPQHAARQFTRKGKRHH
jgi:hypothetical protein